MMFRSCSLGGLLLLGTVALAHAQPSAFEPASCLLFPLYDSRPEAATLITVTNTNRVTISVRTELPRGR